MTINIREARLPQDEPAILSFIIGLQDYEAGFESDRRRDPDFAIDHWRDVQHRCAEKHGAMFIAEENGEPLGWAFAYEEHGQLLSRSRNAATASWPNCSWCRMRAARGLAAR